MSTQELNKYSINYTRDDRVRYVREQFIRMYIKKHLDENPDIKQSLEDKFQQLIKEEFDDTVAQ